MTFFNQILWNIRWGVYYMPYTKRKWSTAYPTQLSLLQQSCDPFGGIYRKHILFKGITFSVEFILTASKILIYSMSKLSLEKGRKWQLQSIYSYLNKYGDQKCSLKFLSLSFFEALSLRDWERNPKIFGAIASLLKSFNKCSVVAGIR